MKMKILYKFAWIMPFVAGLFLMSYTPHVNSIHQDENAKVITVDTLVHDFGTIKAANGSVNHVFTLTNHTDAPIVISNVIATCGCSNTSWTKEPIAPGKTGKVTVIFNPQGQYGPFDKNIIVVTSGTPNRITLKIKGIVE